MSNKINVIFLLLLFIFSISTIANSGTTGKIAGFVKDNQTGDILAGANVVIEGTTMGAATDVNGYYFIINIPPGKYRVKASMMGYQAVVKTEVQVVIDLTTKLDFELSATVLAGEAVEIVAERPLLEKDVTASQTITTAEEIDQMPVNNFQQVLVIAPGFVESGTNDQQSGYRQFNVRGGRPDEMSYMIDGFYVEDPLFGGTGSAVANVGIAELAVMTGTFNAEYGEALSGVLNIVTKEGGNNYTGRFRFRTDKYVNPHEYKYLYKHLNDEGEWIKLDESGEVVGLVRNVGTHPVEPGKNKDSEQYWDRKTKNISDFNTYRPDFYFGGPLPFLPRGNTFFIAGDMLNSDTYLGWTDMTYTRDRRINGKLILKPHQSMKLALGGNYEKQEYQIYNHSYKYVPDIRPTYFNDNYMLNMTFTHTLNPSTFYTLRAARFTSERHRYHLDAEDYFSGKVDGEWSILDPDPNSPTYGQYTGNSEEEYPDEEYEFWKGRWFYTEDETGAVVDSVWHLGDWGEWRERINHTTTAKLDITSQVSNIHQVKMGFEYKQLDLNYHLVYGAWQALPTVRNYNHKPKEGSAYIQDKMEFENWGMVINAGLRLDLMDTDSKYYVDNSDPLNSEWKDAETKIHLSPRLGFAHPITDRAVLHFAYGHFYQVPQYQYLYHRENQDYENYPTPDLSVDGVYTQTGSANLKPEKNVIYEAGVNTRLTENIAIDVTFYYRDIFDYIAMRRYAATPVNYHRIVNMDYANAKGVEISLEKRFSNYFSAIANYTYSHAEGNAADVTEHWDDWYSFSVNETYPPKKTVTMEWDQTHTFNFVVTFARPGNWNITFAGNYGSGMPYTPLSARGQRLDEPNSARMPWTMNVDMRASRQFDFKGLQCILYADITNIFNKINIYDVHGRTGLPDATNSWDDTEDWVDDPVHFGPPRTLELGVSLGF